MIVIGTAKFCGVGGYVGVVVALVGGVCLALVSCFVVERPALRLKKVFS